MCTKTKFWNNLSGPPVPLNIQTDALNCRIYCLDYPEEEGRVDNSKPGVLITGKSQINVTRLSCTPQSFLQVRPWYRSASWRCCMPTERKLGFATPPRSNPFGRRGSGAYLSVRSETAGYDFLEERVDSTTAAHEEEAASSSLVSDLRVVVSLIPSNANKITLFSAEEKRVRQCHLVQTACPPFALPS